jgi:hypothetical protein
MLTIEMEKYFNEGLNFLHAVDDSLCCKVA